jgi:guanine deaminase
VDLARLAVEAEQAVERLERLNHSNAQLYQQLEPIVGSFCPGLAAQPYHVHRYGGCQHCGS